MKPDRFTDTLLRIGAIKIKEIAQACGSVTTGRKAIIVQLLKDAVERRIRSYHMPYRIVSIDLGIKNIGVAQVLAPPLTSPPVHKAVVEEWYRGSLPEAKPYTYPEFADMALNFTNSLVSNHDYPVDGVIMERQRFRSTSSGSIPNDILKVNVLEGMAFTALRATHPDLLLDSVPPKYILSFWKPHYDKANELPRKKTMAANYRIAKRARQQLVNRWLVKSNTSPIEFSPRIRDAMLTPAGKRDDINDALVQALTWLNWRRNSFTLVQNIEAGIDPMLGMDVPDLIEDDDF